ncbi:phage minor head protein [Halocynthiibacter namhaensis]|uniref:phage head morphogenesis protein n=1 Tax=Halocynthiibacter namhaensis TaxID=1290553 RepID=UPI00068B5B24|nr:phage minor head protein [Halocynthiibacter namhaensis]
MTEFTDKPGYSFNPGPPPEVSKFFRNKELLPAFSFHDVEPEEHAVGFTVAKAMNVDVLESIQGALQKAIDEGIPYDQFARELKPRLRRLGWWGVKDQIDPLTGKVQSVRLGSPRRLKTIYRANMRSARAAGQWDRIQRSKRALPYLVYLLGPSERHRPTHQAKSGLVLQVDDPFWQTWYPPNGWNCACHVRQITRREAETRGIGQSPRIPMRDTFNPRTGEIKPVPSGIDPGWESNPGLVRQRHMERLLAEKLDAATPDIARVAARDMATSWRMQRLLDGSAKGSVSVAMLPEDLARAIGSRSRVVQVSDETLAGMKEAGDVVEVGDLAGIADLVETGRAVVADDGKALVIEGSDVGLRGVKIENVGDDGLRLVGFGASN